MTTEFGAEHMDGHGENGESLRILKTDRADREQIGSRPLSTRSDCARGRVGGSGSFLDPGGNWY